MMSSDTEMQEIKIAAESLNASKKDSLDFAISVDAVDLSNVRVPTSNDREFLIKEGEMESQSGRVKPSGPCSCLSLTYYQPYFDVDTSHVQERLLRVLIPTKENPSFTDIAKNSPDAYGPFWISATLIFAMASCSNVASWMDRDSKSKGEWSYDFSRVASAFTLVSAYLVGLPLIVWSIGKYLSVPIPLAMILCLYGYSLLIYIFAAVLCIIPSDASDWFVLLASMFWSLFFIFRHLWAVISEHVSKEKMVPLLGAVGIIHLVWIIMSKVFFF